MGENCKNAALYEINLIAREYRLILVSRADNIESCERYKKCCVELPHRCGKFFRTLGTRSVVEADHSGMCIILLMDHANGKGDERSSRDLLSYLERHRIRGVAVSVGKSMDSVRQIVHSYRTASSVLSYRMLYAEDGCLFYDDVRNMMNISTLRSVGKVDKTKRNTAYCRRYINCTNTDERWLEQHGNI